MAATERTLNAEESTLCEKCSVLRINDKELGGHRTQNDDGEDTPGLFSGQTVFEQHLDYEHCDLLPDLPYLRDTAEAGCAFCAMLRNSTLGRGFANPARVTFGLTYCWSSFQDSEHAICALWATWRVEEGEPGSYHLSGVGTFEVDCKEGDSRTDLLKALSDCSR